MEEKITIPPIDILLPTDVTHVILFLEDNGYSEQEVKEWFNVSMNDYTVQVDLYYQDKVAGDPGTLQNT